MRKAIAVATGYDPGPRRDFNDCPVHVVVLASKIGPVPYELEDVYPANVSGGGVKHFEKPYYERVKPILAERMARYILTHRDNYDKITTFTHDRYGEVMEEARDIVVDRGGNELFFSILPVAGGPGTVLTGKYWSRFWIQLYMEITSWLEPDKQAQADERLRKMYPKIYEVLMRYNTPEKRKR